MRLILFPARRSIIQGTMLGAIAITYIQPVLFLRAQSPAVTARPNVHLPQEAAGLDAIATALIGAFDQVDIVALGEAHDRKVDSDLRIALVRHPEFAKRVKSIVIECGSISEQLTLDRYIKGENIPASRLQRVWKTTAPGSNGFCDAPIYADFLATVRDVNLRLPVDARIRVFGGDPRAGVTPKHEPAAISVLKEHVGPKTGKALMIYGAAHFYRTGPPDYLASLGDDIGIASSLDLAYPGRWLAVIPIGGLSRPPAIKQTDVEPDYKKFDQALNGKLRPVLVSLRRSPFENFSAEKFLGRTLTTCRGTGGCRSVFKGSNLTLGRMADAAIYVGSNPESTVQRESSKERVRKSPHNGRR